MSGNEFGPVCPNEHKSDHKRGKRVGPVTYLSCDVSIYDAEHCDKVVDVMIHTLRHYKIARQRMQEKLFMSMFLLPHYHKLGIYGLWRESSQEFHASRSEAPWCRDTVSVK